MSKESISKPSDLMTLKEAAEYLRCSKVSIWRKRKNGQLIGIKAGGKILFKKNSVEAYLESNSDQKNMA